MLEKNINLYCDRILLGCMCLLIFFLPFLKAGIEVCAWFAFFIWLIKKIISFRYTSWTGVISETPLNNVLLVLVFANLISMFFSFCFPLSFRGFFGKELKFLIIFFILIEVIKSEGRLKGVLFSIIASAVIIVFDSWVQYSRGTDFFKKYILDGTVRLRATFNSANGFAAWLIIIIPILSGLLLSRSLGIKKNILHPWLYVGRRFLGKVLLFLLIGSLLFCLLMTYSRGAWLGLVVSVFLMICYMFKSFTLKIRIIFLCVLVFSCIVFFNLPLSLKNRITDVGQLSFKSTQSVNERIRSAVKISEGSSGSIRMNLWKESFLIISDYPFSGSGLNTYGRIAPKYKITEEGGMYPHNSFFHKTAETGFLGLFSFLAFLIVFFGTGLRYLRKNSDFLVLGLLTGVLAFLIHSFFDNHLYALQLAVLFWYMLGLTIAVIKIRSDAADA
jgi:putative inorganic carbon (HCO3(-)) transporter